MSKRCLTCGVHSAESKMHKARIAELDKELDRMHQLYNETAKYRDMYMNASTNYRNDNLRMREALTKLRDCDWVISLPDRMDAVRDIAKAALLGGGE